MATAPTEPAHLAGGTVFRKGSVTVGARTARRSPSRRPAGRVADNLHLRIDHDAKDKNEADADGPQPVAAVRVAWLN
jgi:hypothetical protein